jgi:hypothetical protein
MHNETGKKEKGRVFQELEPATSYVAEGNLFFKAPNDAAA